MVSVSINVWRTAADVGPLREIDRSGSPRARAGDGDRSAARIATSLNYSWRRRKDKTSLW
jgi:hypothetical protein